MKTNKQTKKPSLSPTFYLQRVDLMAVAGAAAAISYKEAINVLPRSVLTKTHEVGTTVITPPSQMLNDRATLTVNSQASGLGVCCQHPVPASAVHSSSEF